MITTVKAKATKLPNGMQVQSQTKNFTLLIDEPEQLGGTDKGMSPIEALLCSLGGCQAIVAAAFAKAQNVSFEDFYVDIEGDIDLAGFMGKEGVRPGFQEIRYTMHFKTDESQETMEKFAAFIERTCPIGDSLENTVKLVNAGIVIE